MFKILINTDISVLEFYRYIGNIEEISIDILIKISMEEKWFKIHENVYKTFKK